MKRYLLFLLMSICCKIGTAQTISVKDNVSLTPIQGVIVRVGGNEIYSTDKNGIANINNLKINETIELSCIGYSKKITNLAEITKNNFVVYLSERAYNTNEVVISANRFEESSEKLPQHIAVLKAKSIEKSNVQTTADLIQNTGLVNVQKSQAGGGSPMIRGFEANKVLMVVDGVRMNNAIYRGGHLQNVISMDQSSLERMEILFGAGSLLYGSDALGGVISFYTKDPKLSNSKNLNINGSAYSRYVSSNNERTAHVDLSIANDRFGSLTSFTASDFGDLRQGKNRSSAWGSLGIRNFYQDRINGVDTMMKNDDSLLQKSSGYFQYDLMQKILFKQNDRLTHVVSLQYSNSSNVPRYDRLSEIGASGKFNNAEWYYGPQKRMMLSYQLRLKGSRFYNEAQVTLAYQDIEESRHSRGWGKSKLNHRIENVKVYSLNADYDKMIKKFDLRYGLEIVMNDVESIASAENIVTGAITALDTRYPDGGSKTNSASLYATADRAINNKISLQAGLRANYYSLNSKFVDKTFFPFPFNEINQNSAIVTGQLGVVYHPTNTWKIGINLSTGYRSPNVDDVSKVFESTKGDTIGSSSTIGTIIVPNPDLTPEKTYNFELSISKNIADKLYVKGIFFTTKIIDGIVTQNSTFNGSDYILFGDTLSRVQRNVNASEAMISGITGLLNYEITSNLSASASYNFTKGKITSVTPVSPLDHIAPAFGKVSFVWTAKKMRAEAFSIFNAAKELKDYNIAGEDNLNYATVNGMPAWYTLNLRCSYQFNKYFQAQVNLDNITDQAYRVFASGINSSGRNVGVTLRANF
jgi:hemoglobin/transferrin/lactoferrin receptor protein